MPCNLLNMRWFKYGLLFLFSVIAATYGRSLWTWTCVAGKCVKNKWRGKGSLQSMAVCKLLCDPYLNLWPRPTGDFKMSKSVKSVNPFNISVRYNGALDNKLKKTLHKAGKLFQTQLERQARKENVTSNHFTLFLLVELNIDDPQKYRFIYDVDERYKLILRTEYTRVKATIFAPMFFGARHGLETLSQLVVFDDVSRQFVVPGQVNCMDGPVYPYRGIMLDTSRHYFSVKAIKRTLDAMAANKLNTFHWHITDAASFPFQSKKYPQLSRYGAYAPRKVYTHEDIRRVVEYGRVRGILILPELDLPAHVGEGWQWAPNTTVCFKANPWRRFCSSPPCGQLDPTNDYVYNILENLFTEFLEVFDSGVFHMGGNEVNFNCWDSSYSITKWMSNNKYSRSNAGFRKLLKMFQEKSYARLTKANRGNPIPVILRSNQLTDSGQAHLYLGKEKYVIQIWNTSNDEIYSDVIQGFNVIISNYDALYFDCGFGAWLRDSNSWCSPYIGWQKVYDNDPLTLLKEQGGNLDDPKVRNLVLGAEGVLFTEQSDEAVLDSRLWPRASALAERLWSRPREDWEQAESRILEQRERLIRLGIKADRLEPEWCLQNQGSCSV